MNVKPLVNIVIRAFTMLSRFVLIFSVAKYLPDSAMGLYGLITVTIVFLLYFVGLDFYTFSTRELIKNSKNTWGCYLKSQISFTALLYVVFAPILILIFYLNFLPWLVFPYFIIVLVLEHFCQECQRIIIADLKPLVANIGLFIRSGFWPVVLLSLLHFDFIPRNIVSILIAWIIGNFVAACFFIIVMLKMGISGWTRPVDWEWVIKGAKVCSLLLLGTLALRFASTIDRYWLQSFTNLEIVGVYSFFLGISGVVPAFIDAAVISFKYPLLIKSVSERNGEKYLKIKKDLCKQVCFWLFILVILSLFLLDVVLNIVGKDIYFKYKNMYYVSLATAVISCVALLPHYELYARREDKIITIIHVTGLFFFVLMTFLISFIDRVYAIPISALAMQFYILFAKVFFNKLSLFDERFDTN